MPPISGDGFRRLEKRRSLRQTKLTDQVPLFALAYNGPDNQPSAFREGLWKLRTRLVTQTGGTGGFAASRGKPLLFNVEQDLGERIDRAAEHPGIVARLLGRMDALSASFKAEHSKD